MSTENWSEERSRIMELLSAIESGTVTHMEKEGTRELRRMSEGDITALRARLAELTKRLGPIAGA